MSSTHYVDNKKFTIALTKWTDEQRRRKARGWKQKRVTPYLAESILAICKNISRRVNFIAYPYRDEMVGDAIENCIKYLRNFNGEKYNNGFGYVSMVAYRSMVRKIKREKLLHTKHLKFIKGLVDISELSNVINANNDDDPYYAGYVDNMQSLLDDLEEVEDYEVVKAQIEDDIKSKKEMTVLEIYMEQGEPL